MNVVFMNQLEKETEENRFLTAQVVIGESQGVWKVIWNEDVAVNEEQVWYEGRSWEEMLHEFHVQITGKMGQGYFPLLETVTDPKERFPNNIPLAHALEYYAESSMEEETFQQLRQWRREEAKKGSLLPYMIATDKMLRMLAVYKPYTAEELKMIPGFGEQKCRKYESVLSVLKTMPRTHEFPLHWVRERLDLQQFRAWIYKQQHQRLTLDNERKDKRKQLLIAVSQGHSLQQLEQQLSLRRRELVQWLEELEQGGYDLTGVVHTELQAYPEELKQKVLESFKRLGDRYLKPIYSEVYKDQSDESQSVEKAYEQLRMLRLYYRGASSQQAAEAV